jgi:hypothetical protein
MKEGAGMRELKRRKEWRDKRGRDNRNSLLRRRGGRSMRRSHLSPCTNIPFDITFNFNLSFHCNVPLASCSARLSFTHLNRSTSMDPIHSDFPIASSSQTYLR